MEIVLYIFVAVSFVMQSACTKIYTAKSYDVAGFNAVKTICAMALFALMNINGLEIHPQTILMGALYGGVLSVSTYFGYMSLKTGPMSLTSMMVSFSVLIPVAYGMFFCAEPLTMYRMCGILMLLIAIFYVSRSKNDSSGIVSGKWVVYVAITFMANGLCSVIQKLHQLSFPGMYCEEFMLCGMSLCACVFGGCALKLRRVNLIGKSSAILAGIANAGVGYCTILLAGTENASVLFPVISAATILMSLAYGRLVLREKLNINQLISIAFGVGAIWLLKR